MRGSPVSGCQLAAGHGRWPSPRGLVQGGLEGKPAVVVWTVGCGCPGILLEGLKLKEAKIGHCARQFIAERIDSSSIKNKSSHRFVENQLHS